MTVMSATFWSSIYAWYMFFWSSGSQQSNASNSAWFEVEMKELHPLEADHSKLKEDFCTAAKSALGYEHVVLLLRNFVALLYAQLRCSLEASQYLQPTFWIFCFRYLMSKSPNSPCNPPIIWFLKSLSKNKGWITSYI